MPFSLLVHLCTMYKNAYKNVQEPFLIKNVNFRECIVKQLQSDQKVTVQ
jgi:hypothetical protein